ncbi:MAG: hypothetical protein IT585_04680 [candidate division Zixibacteria bacterium]|nr:hypothetical protein [candidate division Zixibacteria bacterium]
MRDTSTQKSFQLLKDQPLQGVESGGRGLFGHCDIAATLVQVVENCPTPFTIGLFGKWGSGKSTIANMIAANLKNRSIPVVLFDVWKHEGDSLRRSFLKELVRQLRSAPGNPLETNFQLNDRLEHSVNRNHEGRLRLNKEKTAQLVIVSIVLFVVLAAVGIVGTKLGLPGIVASAIGTIFGGGLIVWLLNLFTQILGTETTTFSNEKLQDPHEFEDEFARIIVASKSSRTLIIFDNLDRVTHEKALETLTTIKTFLEPKDLTLPNKGIVFLIPCDDKAIRAHITAVYGKNSAGTSAMASRAFDPDEFLRKFFNTVLWIPEFISSELESYARSCLKSTGIDDLNDEGIAWLVTKAFRDNPRQIIQFVNILVSNFLLIREREGEGKDFEPEFAKKNRLEICLYLLLNHLYPNVMAELRNLKATSLEEHQLESLNSVGIDENTAKQFLAFVSEVKSEVRMTNLRTYYALRRSDQEKKFPGIDRLFEMLEDNEIAKAKEQAQGMDQLGNDIEALSYAIKTHFENITNPTGKAHFLNGLLQILTDRKITLNQSCYAQFHSTLTSAEFQERIDTISPRHLYANMLSHHSQFQQSVVERWVQRLEVIAPEENLRKTKSLFIAEAFELFAEVPTLIDQLQARVQKVLASQFASDVKTLRLFMASDKAQSAAFSKPLVEAFIQSISDRDLAGLPKSEGQLGELQIPERWQMILSFSKSLFDAKHFTLSVTKFIELLNLKAPIPLSPEVERDRNVIFFAIRKALSTFGSLATKDTPLSQLTDSIITNANTFADWPRRIQAVALLFDLHAMVEEAKKPSIASFIQQFCTSATPEAIRSCGTEVGGVQVLLNAGPFTSPLEQRSVAEPEMFNVFYDGLTDQKKTEWLLKILASNPTEAFRRFKALKYEIPDREKIVSQLLAVAAGYSAAQKPGCYEACIGLRCADKPELIDQFADQLLTHLKLPDSNNQKIGYDAATKADFLTKKNTRSIVKGIFDWIDTLPSASKYQVFALEFICYAVDQLNKQEKEKLADICLDELVVKSNDVNAIKLAFRLLTKMKLSEGDFSRNFVDIQNYYNSSADQSIKNEIRDGLRSLDPKDNGQDDEFRKWVDSLS